MSLLQISQPKKNKPREYPCGSLDSLLNDLTTIGGSDLRGCDMVKYFAIEDKKKKKSNSIISEATFKKNIRKVKHRQYKILLRGVVLSNILQYCSKERLHISFVEKYEELFENFISQYPTNASDE